MACLVTLAAGLALERGALLVGLSIVAAVLAVSVWIDASVRRLRARRRPPSAR